MSWLLAKYLTKEETQARQGHGQEGGNFISFQSPLKNRAGELASSRFEACLPANRERHRFLLDVVTHQKSGQVL